MPEKISWNLNVQVSGGPKISAAQVITVEAYDKIEVIIPAGAKGGTAVEVEIQPGVAGQVRFLLIAADQYDEKLTYKVTGATTSGIKLDAPHLLIGEGGVGLYGANPNSLTFENDTAKDATVQLLVGRNAKAP